VCLPLISLMLSRATQWPSLSQQRIREEHAATRRSREDGQRASASAPVIKSNQLRASPFAPRPPSPPNPPGQFRRPAAPHPRITTHYPSITTHYPSITTHYHPLYQPLPRITTHCHPLPHITTHYHPLPRITKKASITQLSRIPRLSGHSPLLGRKEQVVPSLLCCPRPATTAESKEGVTASKLHLASKVPCLSKVRNSGRYSGQEGGRAVRIFRSAVAPKGQSIAIGGSVAQSGQTIGDSGAETHSIGLGCKVLFRLGLRWSEVARGQSDLTTCFKHQCVRVGTLGSAPVY
jgi:hypothetical protein